MSQAGVLFMRIELLLNPKERDHIALCKFLGLAYLNISDKTVGEGVLTDITETSQTILKDEWEVVKKGRKLLNNPQLAALQTQSL